MKRLAYTLTLGILVGFLLLVSFPVQAIPSASLNARPDACGLDGTGLSERMNRLLDSLEEKGFDVSAIRAALGNGDTGTARTLLQQFLQQNRDALPAPDTNQTRMDRMGRLLDSLEEKGFDVSAIRAALGSGDTGTARTLLQQFLQQNRDALPEKPSKIDNPARGVSQAGNTDSPAVNNPASTGNTTVFRTRHGKGLTTQKSIETA
ncbi:MAG: hypothetical protein QHG97_05630 [Methanolinea sp.]|nr:hypothetical protein [Methanolinea sp.]